MKHIDPIFTPAVEGPWMVGSDSSDWYVVHRDNGRTKKIGRIGAKGTNYFDRAIGEAGERNRKARSTSGDLDAALAHLQELITLGAEYPDAQYRAARTFGVDAEALQDAYDRACEKRS